LVKETLNKSIYKIYVGKTMK
jgi:hypothetical protein